MKGLTLNKNGHVVIEEVPTNNASNGANAGLPPDEPPVRRKKRKNKMGIDIFQRIRNSRIKEQTMENQTTIKEYSSDEKTGSGGGSNEVSATMRFIQQKRKMNKKQEREKRAANRKKEIETISRAKSADYAKKGKERQKKLATQIKQNNSFEFGDGLVYLESLCELADEGKITTFFFADETELELTQEQASVIVDRFNQLSEENKEKLVAMLPESKEIFTTFMTM